MKKRKGLIWFVGLLVLMLMGCASFNIYEGKRYYTDLTIIISSDDARDVHVYLPFPHYKGKPDMKILKWLRENLEYRKKWENYSPETKIDLIDTEYGKMLYIYIPNCYIKLSTGEMGSSREIKINLKTVTDDYKLTYEDKIKPEKEWPDPESKWLQCKLLNMPMYVKFEGEKLRVSYGYNITKSFHHGMGILCLYYGGPLDREFFTESGWQRISVKKYMIKTKEEE